MRIQIKFDLDSSAPLLEQLVAEMEEEIKRLNKKIKNYWKCDQKDRAARIRCLGKPASGLEKLMAVRERLKDELIIYRQHLVRSADKLNYFIRMWMKEDMRMNEHVGDE